MLNNNIFYHQATRKTIVAFGTLFSGIKLLRSKNGVEQTIAVPIAYAPKEKWIVRIEQDPTLENHTYTVLPKMSFEITGMSYDPSRKTNRMSSITATRSVAGSAVATQMYSPVPYNIDISLYALTKTQEDGLQIVEQILPYFTPEYTMVINSLSEMNVNTDVPIILNSVSVDDQYDGDFETRRFITYTMNFTLKTMLFGPVNDAKVILTSTVPVVNTGVAPAITPAYGTEVATGNLSTGAKTSTWSETL
jgi:hypothetical protein